MSTIRKMSMKLATSLALIARASGADTSGKVLGIEKTRPEIAK